MQYPLEKIVWLLKFDGPGEAQSFLEHHGLIVRDEIVTLERGSYVDPEAVFPTRRAILLIGSKLRTSVGEVGYWFVVICRNIHEFHANL